MNFDVVQYVMLIGTFLVAFAILRKILYQPLVASLDTRHEKIIGDLTKAREEREQMEKMRREYEHKLQEAEQRVTVMMREAAKTADSARLEMVERAKAC